jgi:hypothetical protein|nr:MAG TPA: hypothetical protein [Caudoviricetes sp.]
MNKIQKYIRIDEILLILISTFRNVENLSYISNNSELLLDRVMSKTNFLIHIEEDSVLEDLKDYPNEKSLLEELIKLL